MDSKQEKSWTITEVVDLVKDLGPRENTTYSQVEDESLQSQTQKKTRSTVTSW